MSALCFAWEPSSPLLSLPNEASQAGRVSISHCNELNLASVVARKGMEEVVAQRLNAHFGIQVLHGPHRTTSGGFALLGTSPTTWLAVLKGERIDVAASLRAILAESASVADQSGAYLVLRLAGSKVRSTLAKMIPIDLHERSFHPDDVAVTSASDIGVILWRAEENGEAATTFEIAVHRSLATDFCGFLAESAAEFLGTVS
jgi:heterotetrameric sarcosine oxidase gamma subunit